MYKRQVFGLSLVLNYSNKSSSNSGLTNSTICFNTQKPRSGRMFIILIGPVLPQKLTSPERPCLDQSQWASSAIHVYVPIALSALWENVGYFLSDFLYDFPRCNLSSMNCLLTLQCLEPCLKHCWFQEIFVGQIDGDDSGKSSCFG